MNIVLRDQDGEIIKTTTELDSSFASLGNTKYYYEAESCIVYAVNDSERRYWQVSNEDIPGILSEIHIDDMDAYDQLVADI